MKAPALARRVMGVGAVLRWRLRDIGRLPRDLAEATDLPTRYIEDLIAGRRRPPRPGLTDVYTRMTAFLRLSPDYLDACARAERDDGLLARPTVPRARIRRLLLRLCEPATARTLERRRVQFGSAEVVGIAQRLLDAVQSIVGRELADARGLRATTDRTGRPYPLARAERLEFMDRTLDTLRAADVSTFIRLHIMRWDVDLRTGALRIVIRDHRSR